MLLKRFLSPIWPSAINPPLLKSKKGASFWASLLIFGIIFFLLWLKNFPFNTWYTGWDNLHPEFNFGMNFRRGLSSVWQTNQGLGTYGGHGYAATLPHTVITFLMSLIIPLKYIRSSFTFLTLLTGGLGVLFLLRKIIKEEGIFKNLSALTGALFYLLNLSTIQNYYIQLEAFIFHFAFLPWLFLTLIDYLESNKRKDLNIFCLVTFISSTQGFVPPLFFVYLVVLTIFLLAYLFKQFSRRAIGRVVLVFLVTIFLNAYWLMPVTYYSLTHSNVYLDSYNNINSTEDFILKNQKYGTIDNAVLLKGFLLEAIDTKENGSVFQIFYPWNDHLDKPIVKLVGYFLFILIIVGLLSNLKKREYFYSWGILASFLIIFSLLVTATPPFSFLTETIQRIPILRQAFRVAYTKFSLSLALFYAICLGLGFLKLLELIKVIFKKIFFVFFAGATIVALNVFFVWPVFKGNLLYDRTKLDIPDIYFEVFNYFKNQDKQVRIANFPQGWHWGWSLYRWGYSGSGFLWYGVEQPILDRAFDVWGRANENYYWEISQAIYSENFSNLEKIFAKYQIDYLLFDFNEIPYPNVKGFLYTDKLEKYLNSSVRFKLARTFNSNNSNVDKIKIYKFLRPSSTKSFTRSLVGLKNIGPAYSFDNFDQPYSEFGDYYSDPKQKWEIYYPFRSLFSGRKVNDFPIEIMEKDDFFIFKDIANKGLLGQIKESFPLESEISTPSSIYLLDDKITAEFRKTNIYNSEKDLNFFNHAPINCGSNQNSQGILKQEIFDNEFIRFKSLNSDNCYTIELGNLPHRYSYLIKIKNRHLEGKRMQLALINHDSRKADLELLLTEKKDFETNYIIIPPMKDFGLGYSLSFNNVSSAGKASVNDLGGIEIYEIPYGALKSIKIIDDSSVQGQNQWLIYSQSFDSGWLAFRKTGKFSFEKLTDHVLVNNWENGWRLETPVVTSQSSVASNQSLDCLKAEDCQLKTIYIFFWPQLFEYLGFVLLLATPLVILKFKSD